MPIYVYGCDSCGHKFEQMQKFQDAPLTVCPKCGASIRRILQPAGIVFKGSGWYSTDSRASGSATTPSSTTSPAASEGGSKEASTDSAASTPAPAPTPAE